MDLNVLLEIVYKYIFYMDLLVIRLRSNQLKFLFVAAKPQDKNYLL